MKNTYVSLVVLIIIFIGCADDHMDRTSIGVSAELNVKDARSYFEEKIQTLQPVNIVEHDLIRTRSECEQDLFHGLTPFWKEASFYRHGKISSIELPIVETVMAGVSMSERKNGDVIENYITTSEIKLIIQRNEETGAMRYFVATLIGDKEYLESEKVNSRRFHFFGDTLFSGITIISNAFGTYKKSYLHKDGRKKSVFLIPNIELVGADTLSFMSFRFLPINAGGVETRGDIPWFDGGGDGGDYNCPRCNNAGCSYCTITVTWCRRCDNVVENRACCYLCGSFPCICDGGGGGDWSCQYCGDFYCRGECQQEHGGDGSNPGGGSENENGESPQPSDGCTICTDSVVIRTTCK